MQRRFVIFFLLITTAGIRSSAQRPEDVINYIATYKNMAINEMKRTGVPAAIKLAQGIHETEAGKSNLVVRSNNHFGIKCKTSWAGDKVYHDDDARGECFRSYSTPEDSYVDHSDFLRKSTRYAFLFELDPTDYEAWAYGLKKAGYATNIRYSQVLINIIRNYNLQDYSLVALGQIKESDHVMANNKTLIPYKSPSPKTVIEEAKPQIVAPSYPTGEFIINKTKVIYVDANTAWLALAEQYNIPLSRLLDFNDLERDDDILPKGQLIYLQLKRKIGFTEFHIVQMGESLYDVCQTEGIRFESLIKLNHLNGSEQPATGEKLYLQYSAPAAPLLMTGTKNRKSSNDIALIENPSPINGQKSFVSKNSDTSIDEMVTKLGFTTHQVTTKETLYSISRKYGVELEKIKEWNSLDSLNVKIGQTLIIYKNN